MNIFRGMNRTGPYFEGWYFKQQNPRGQALAPIPAFHTGRGGQRTASLQVISKDRAWWLEYPASQLHVSRRPFLLRNTEKPSPGEGLFDKWQKDQRREIFSQDKAENRRNTLCISRFLTRSGGKRSAGWAF